MTKSNGQTLSLKFRQKVVVLTFVVASTILIFKVIEIQITDGEFLIKKGLQQYNKIEKIPTTRGKIFDRNGELLAISVESESIYVRPKEFLEERNRRGHRVGSSSHPPSGCSPMDCHRPRAR